MKSHLRQTISVIILSILSGSLSATAGSQIPKFRHIEPVVEENRKDTTSMEEVPEWKAEPDSTYRNESVEWAYTQGGPKIGGPKVFTGYRSLSPQLFHIPDAEEMVRDLMEPQVSMQLPSPLSENLKAGFRKWHAENKLAYFRMIDKPDEIQYASWDFPKPPPLPDFDRNYNQLFRKFEFPPLVAENKIETEELEHRNWLHFFNVGLQFSQAYVSANWYQGGNNYLALLFNFTWNVDLNPVYHPNLLFQSSLSYKLSINSNPKENLHRYSLTQDNFQYNLKMGVKALEHWFYSFTLQFRTPFFNTYPPDSEKRTAALLSPGSLNLGLGMTFNKENKKKTWKLSASIAPVSYNLKTCVVNDVDHLQFNIPADRKTASEIGSNLEANMTWVICDNVTWTSRLFLFTDYKYFLADWENTFNFTINRFLSTQLYIHPRYDSSSDFNSTKWHYWMLKEILSVGLSYTFSTK